MKQCRNCQEYFEPTESQKLKHDWLCSKCRRKANKKIETSRENSGIKMAICRVCGTAYKPNIGQIMKYDWLCGSCKYAYNKRTQDQVKQKDRINNWRKSDIGKANTRKRSEEYRNNPANRKAIRAHEIVKLEILMGRLKKQPCEECKNPVAEAHHEDYDKPLKIIWLCRTHHQRLHITKREQEGPPSVSCGNHRRV